MKNKYLIKDNKRLIIEKKEITLILEFESNDTLNNDVDNRDTVKKNIRTSMIYSLSFDNLEDNTCEKNIGSIQFSMNHHGITRSKKVVNINNLNVEEQYRGNGFGTLLIKEALFDSYNMGMLYAELDDMSDRFRQTDNIYIKIGFKYINDECEMRGKIKDMIKLF
jgi:GNAT superfamily N-acetyltransferase